LLTKPYIKRSGVVAADRFPSLVGVGTVPYMSPERLLHAKPDHRSDIFSLGIILYEVLCGSPPYLQDLDVPTQLVSQSYYKHARDVLSRLGHKRLSELVLTMIHPEPTRRTSDYDQVLKVVKSI
jgi:serine/threonine-protein kinase